MSQKDTNEGATAPIDDGIDLVFDVKLRRPACVLLQAAFGCGHNNGFLQSTFEAREWLDQPTQDMRRIRGTREQWQQLARRARP